MKQLELGDYIKTVDGSNMGHITAITTTRQLVDPCSYEEHTHYFINFDFNVKYEPEQLKLVKV